MGDVVEKFLTPMKRHFLTPETAKADPAAFWRDYVRDLSRFDDATLTEAADRLRRREGGKSVFPMLSNCVWMCDQVAESLAREASSRDPVAPSRPLGGSCRQSDDVIAEGLIRCDLGHRAAQEGWIGELFDFARRNRRLPDIHEAEAAKAAAAATEARWRATVGDSRGTASRAYQAVQFRRQRLANLVLGTQNPENPHRGPQDGRNGVPPLAS